ncbi:hypothetical protein AB0M79_34420 [Polymorphospora sp. NPDC051019]|uniref:hypothetical protein n=1 Tax=Polymorphospora sp. NPDC051019 TaxID=3155725 RepID=UPI0034371D85
MQPPVGASGALLNPVDAFDVPVLVRRSSPLAPGRRPHPSHIERADQSWPVVNDVPPDGLYRVQTTWRDIIDAALTVGRDPTAWLASVPNLAWSEIVARRSPLVAYLGRQPRSGDNRYRIEPNVVYREGTERSARGAFGYRLGMTMAEWACRGLMGLGPTTHAEAVTPGNAGSAWSNVSSLPDLVGDHPGTPTTWLVEAKGHRKVPRSALLKGARQLSNPNLLTGPHMRVLCGASLEPQLFMSIDIEAVVTEECSGRQADADPVSDDEALLALARSRMLLYLALIAIPVTERRIVPVGPASAVAGRSRNGTVSLLEFDSTTNQERLEARDRDRYEGRDGRERRDMLTGRVPGTDLIIGMSRRLFAACGSLAAVQRRVAIEVDRKQPQPTASERELMSEDNLAIRYEQRRALYWQRERALTAETVASTRARFEEGQQRNWQALLGRQVPITVDAPADVLEAATTDTYLAVDTRTATR